MKISIDPGSGFCFGVDRAIKIAEKELQNQRQLFCLGEIVHNNEEIKRLGKKGLETIDHSIFKNVKKTQVLFRAHGESPEVYKQAVKNQNEVIDATCPIVLKLQQRVKKAFEEMKKINGQIAIFGNPNHPETIGLKGQTENEAIVIEDYKKLNNLNFDRPIRLFAQTTKNINEYQKLISVVEEKVKSGKSRDFKYFNTICRYVSGRIPNLKNFCSSNDVIIFVSGKNSSNGKFLAEFCQSVNQKTFHISSPEELNKSWFEDIQTVGISGATSTPEWLMKEIAEKIKDIA